MCGGSKQPQLAEIILCDRAEGRAAGLKLVDMGGLMDLNVERLIMMIIVTSD